jgi:hypothetical protein
VLLKGDIFFSALSNCCLGRKAAWSMPSTDLAKSAEADKTDAMEPDMYFMGISLQSSIISTNKWHQKDHRCSFVELFVFLGG